MNAPLVSAINLHEVNEESWYNCHIGLDLVDFREDMHKYGLVFMDCQEMTAMSDKVIQVLRSSHVVVTTTEVQPKEMFSKMVEKVKSSADGNAQPLTGLLESVVLFIKKADFDRLSHPCLSPKYPSRFLTSNSLLEGLVAELVDWAGLDRNYLLSSLGEYKESNFSAIAMYLTKLLKERKEEEISNRDKMKKLEIDKKTKDLEAFKKKLQEQDAKKAKEIEEKL